MNVDNLYRGLIHADMFCRTIPIVCRISAVVSRVLTVLLVTRENHQNNRYFFYLARRNKWVFKKDNTLIPGFSYRASYDQLNDSAYIEDHAISSVSKERYLNAAGFDVIHDKKLFMRLVAKDPRTLRCAAKSLQQDMDLIKCAIQNDPLQTVEVVKYLKLNEVLSHKVRFELAKAYMSLDDPEDRDSFIEGYVKLYSIQTDDLDGDDVINCLDVFHDYLRIYRKQENAPILAARDGLTLAFMPEQLRKERKIVEKAYEQNDRAVFFIKDEALKNEMLAKKGIPQLFALIVLHSDAYLESKKSTETSKAARFFRITKALPMELQMGMSHVAFESAQKPIVKVKDLERAVREIV